MAIDGRINVDVLFHDTDGTTALRVVSLEDSTAYTSGKVAIVTGTVGTSAVTVGISPTTYKDASGAIVSFSSVGRVAFAASGSGRTSLQGGSFPVYLYSSANSVAASNCNEQTEFTIQRVSGTASYTLVMYGT